MRDIFLNLLPLQLWTYVFGSVLLIWLTLLSIIDLRSFRLPNTLTYSLLGLGLVQSWLLIDQLTAALIGAFAGFTVFVLVETAFRRLRGRDGLGRGDAKLLAAGGAWLGWSALPYTILIGSFLGLLAALFPMFRRSNTEWIPFGPFLALAIFIVWCAQKMAGL